MVSGAILGCDVILGVLTSQVGLNYVYVLVGIIGQGSGCLGQFQTTGAMLKLIDFAAI